MYGTQKFGHSFSFHEDQKENYVIVFREIQETIIIYTEVKKVATSSGLSRYLNARTMVCFVVDQTARTRFGL